MLLFAGFGASIAGRRSGSMGYLMDIDYWNRVCGDYQEEILSVFDNDLHKVVERCVAEVAASGEARRAADFGCGVGRFTPLLAKAFEEVEACDFSGVGLRKAKRRCRGKRNTRFHQVDLTKGEVPFEPVEFGFCVNVLILPGLDKRLRAWRSVLESIVVGGKLLLVAPSWESAQMEFYGSIAYHLNDGYGCGDAVKMSIEDRATTADLRMGVLQLDGVKTKHYLKPELVQMLMARGFEVDRITRVEYPTDEHQDFRRWDWLAMATKRE
ncbi:MAG: class I SAM-dependent methyltransferase [Verrucomicrobiota bacterium]